VILSEFGKLKQNALGITVSSQASSWRAGRISRVQFSFQKGANKNGIIRGRHQTSSRCGESVISLCRQWVVGKSLESRAAGACGLRELGLAVDLLHAIILLVECIVDLGHVLDADTVGDHLHGVDLALLDHFEKLLPVEVDGCLSVADKADTALHQ
jgi:hypothetical protein